MTKPTFSFESNQRNKLSSKQSQYSKGNLHIPSKFVTSFDIPSGVLLKLA